MRTLREIHLLGQRILDLKLSDIQIQKRQPSRRGGLSMGNLLELILLFSIMMMWLYLGVSLLQK